MADPTQEQMTRIVVVGGGMGGMSFAQAMAKQLTAASRVEVVVIEPKSHLYHAVGTPRAFVDASYMPKLFIPYDHALPKDKQQFVKLVRGQVVAIVHDRQVIQYKCMDANDDDDQTSCDPTQELPYDYLVLATGSTYSMPIKEDPTNHSRKHTEQQFETIRQAVEQAPSVLIIGGGAVACEIAGEIASKFPDKQVTMVEAKDELVAGNKLRDCFRSKLMNALQKLGVRVILNERLVGGRASGHSFEKKTLLTDKGTSIESDIQLLCAGFKPNTKLVEQLDASLLDARGFVRVNGHFAVDDDKYRNVFVLGDASNHPTPKLGYWAGQQAKFLAGELAPIVIHKSLSKSITRDFPEVTVEAMLLPLGPNGGVSQLPYLGGIVVGDFLTRNIKSWDMFASRVWSMFGSSPPS